ncbi:hypothetical protein DFH09DRAFT_1160216 [Mycena vulgaris]|nr:hypothetical protein DFH09DRAFT_1160216 [Mycena vulgaris]
MQTKYERSQTTSRTEMQVLERRIKESQNELNALRAEKDKTDKTIQTLRDDADRAQNAAEQKVIDVEIKFQETLKNSLRIENRHREEEHTFYKRLEEKDETIANLKRENLKGRADRSMAFTRAAAKIEDELHYLHEYEGTYLKTTDEMNGFTSENTQYMSQVEEMQAQYDRNLQNLRTTMGGESAFSSSSSAVTAEVTLRPRPAGKGYEPEQVSVGSEEKTQSHRAHVVTDPNGKTRTVWTEEESTTTTTVTATADGKMSQTIRYSTDVKNS